MPTDVSDPTENHQPGPPGRRRPCRVRLGVLDRLLENERINIEGISATSAGAMNGACVAYGMAIGGRQAARYTLAGFWERVADAACWSPLQPSWYDRLIRNWGLEWSPAFLGFDMVGRLLSPYEFNPLNLNPLRNALAASVDFEELQKQLHPFACSWRPPTFGPEGSRYSRGRRSAPKRC
jgi:predicted acylesterase/phospholipase RssA